VIIDAPENTSNQSGSSSPQVKIRDIASLNGQEPVSKVAYDPSLVFLLEVATSLVIRDKESMNVLSSELATYCTEILRQRKHLHPILVERTLTYLLALKKRGHETVCSICHKSNSRVWKLILIWSRLFEWCYPLNLNSSSSDVGGPVDSLDSRCSASGFISCP
jgi:hypothetical protein